MKLRKIEKECPVYDKCEIRKNPLSAADEPNKMAHLGWRVLYVFVSWSILGLDANTKGYFTSIFLFALPLLMDCIKYNRVAPIRKWILRAEILVVVCWCTFSFLGLANVLTVVTTQDGAFIATASNYVGFAFAPVPITHIQRALLSVVFVTVVDWICNVAFLEKWIGVSKK